MPSCQSLTDEAIAYNGSLNTSCRSADCHPILLDGQVILATRLGHPINQGGGDLKSTLLSLGFSTLLYGTLHYYNIFVH